MATPIAFGTDGWRAVIAREYTFANVRRVAAALAKVLKERAKIVVGYDHRFLSEEFARHADFTLASLTELLPLIDRHNHKSESPSQVQEN